MRGKGAKTSPGVNTVTSGKTSIATTMSSPIAKGKGRSSARKLKGRPTTGR